MKEDTCDVSRQQLESFVASKFESKGLRTDDANWVAETLVRADMRGVHSHGTARLSHYLRRLDAGSIEARPQISVEKRDGATALVDGGHGLGQVVKRYATELAVEIAKEQGAGWVSIKNSSHAGMMSSYGEIISNAGMIGFVFSHVDPMVAPHAAMAPFQGTNPMCIAMPGGGIDDFLFDMATSTIPWNRVMNARRSGDEIESGVALDEKGEETRDPHAVKALLPMAGHKGSALGIAIDLLCSGLSESPYGAHIPPMYGDLSERRRLGGLVGAIDISRFLPVELFSATVSNYAREVRDLPVQPGHETVMMPNDREVQSETRQSEVIELPVHIITELEELGFVAES